MAISKTKTTKKSTTSNKSPDYKNAFNEIQDLSLSLVREIDNLMGSKLPAGQVGKVLGDIVSGFQSKIIEIKSGVEKS
jgi:hypothetical protein